MFHMDSYDSIIIFHSMGLPPKSANPCKIIGNKPFVAKKQQERLVFLEVTRGRSGGGLTFCFNIFLLKAVTQRKA